MNFVQAAVWFVDAVLGLVGGILAVGISGEEFWEDDFVGIGAAHRKSVANYRPLRFAVEAEDLAEIVQEAGEDEPARVAVFADCFRGLE